MQSIPKTTAYLFGSSRIRGEERCWVHRKLDTRLDVERHGAEYLNLDLNSDVEHRLKRYFELYFSILKEKSVHLLIPQLPLYVGKMVRTMITIYIFE